MTRIEEIKEKGKVLPVCADLRMTTPTFYLILDQEPRTAHEDIEEHDRKVLKARLTYAPRIMKYLGVTSLDIGKYIVKKK